MHERHARRLAGEGKDADAAPLRALAMQASLEAVRIQNLVIEHTLGDAGSSAARDR